MAVPAKYKKRFLKEQIENCMNPFRAEVAQVFGTDPNDTILHTETEVGEWRFNWFRNRNLRISVMGNPIWYCEILFTGPSFMTKPAEDGRWLGGIHEYAVSFFLEYKANASTDLFEEMTDGQDENAGIMHYLRGVGIKNVKFPDRVLGPDNGDVLMSIRQTGDEEVYRDQRSVVNFDKSQPGTSDKGHLLTFRVNIVDAV